MAKLVFKPMQIAETQTAASDAVELTIPEKYKNFTLRKKKSLK